MHVIINHWQRALALWSDSCVLIGCPNRQDRSVLPAWNCPPWFRERKAFTKLELFGELSLRKHERLSWVYGATNKVGFPGSGSKNDILYSEQAKSFCKIQIRPLLTKLVRSKWLDIRFVLFFVFSWTETKSRSIKNAKRELRYPVIWPHAWHITFVPVLPWGSFCSLFSCLVISITLFPHSIL